MTAPARALVEAAKAEGAKTPRLIAAMVAFVRACDFGMTGDVEGCRYWASVGNEVIEELTVERRRVN